MVIIAVDLKIPHQVVLWPDAADRNCRDTVYQFEDEIVELIDGGPRQ